MTAGAALAITTLSVEAGSGVAGAMAGSASGVSLGATSLAAGRVRLFGVTLGVAGPRALSASPPPCAVFAGWAGSGLGSGEGVSTWTGKTSTSILGSRARPGPQKSATSRTNRCRPRDMATAAGQQGIAFAFDTAVAMVLANPC